MNFGKYIITEKLEPLLFPSCVTHTEVYKKGVSAGMFRICPDTESGAPLVTCWGESNSLGIESQPVRDEWIIMHFLKKCR